MTSENEKLIAKGIIRVGEGLLLLQQSACPYDTFGRLTHVLNSIYGELKETYKHDIKESLATEGLLEGKHESI